jgi:hypothetical protein
MDGSDTESDTDDEELEKDEEEGDKENSAPPRLKRPRSTPLEQMSRDELIQTVLEYQDQLKDLQGMEG